MGKDAGSHTLTAIVPVLSEPQVLEEHLEEVGKDIQVNPFIPFHRLETTHFLSWVLVPGPRDEQGREGAPRLVCEASFDEPREDFLKRLHREAGSTLKEQVYSHCAPSPWTDAGGFEAFFLAHSRKAALLYAGYPEVSVGMIDEDDGAHWRFHQRIVMGLASGATGITGPQGGSEDERIDQVVDLCHGFVTEAEAPGAAAARSQLPLDPGREPPSWRTRFMRSLPARIARSALVVPAGVVGGLLLGYEVLSSAVAEVRSRLRGGASPLTTADAGEAARKRRAQALARIEDREDHKGQNHLTHYVELKPGLLRLPVLRVVLWGWGQLAKIWFTEGSLGGIEGIHFARWLIIDGGRRRWPSPTKEGRRRWPEVSLKRRCMLFLSNYDGSWERYLSSFIDRGGIGLTTIWCNTQGFPRTRLRWSPSSGWWPFKLELGSDRAEEFKQWVRDHQLPSLIWYSRHPDLSVVNIRRNREIHAGVGLDADPMKRRRWLQLL
ncbi:hypothetical protein ACLESO_25360 [Pyxidicoccus sp. 3LG]